MALQALVNMESAATVVLLQTIVARVPSISAYQGVRAM